MHILLKNVSVIFLLLINYPSFAQFVDLEKGINISKLPGDELNARWSPDGTKLLFQLDNSMGNKICVYVFEDDSLDIISNSDYNFRNPVWHPDGDMIVFDSEVDGKVFLFKLDLKSGSVTQLLNRDIACRNASFSSSSRQVYFAGFDEINHRWEIYNYDFIYDNLNKITSTKFGADDPEISADGKEIIISKTNPYNNVSRFELVNWYGDKKSWIDNIEGEKASWGEAGLKIYFIKNEGDSNSELYSIWKDGSHLEKLTNDNSKLACPAVSPDGSKLAISVSTEDGFDIFILPFEDY